MNQALHFISGLPRSGSTLLGAILRQNPRVHASMTSPLGGLYGAMVQMMSAGSEAAHLIADDQKPAMLRGLFDSFYGSLPGITDTEVIFDTNRQWCARLPGLMHLFPNAKVICTVRNVAWIMDSIERLLQQYPFELTTLFSGPAERATVFHRVRALAKPNSLVGLSHLALREAFYGPYADRLLLVEYDLLAKAPSKVLPLIYQFIGEPAFDHDFENVTFDAEAFDAALGLRGLHRVDRRVAYRPRHTVLPPELFKEFCGEPFWSKRDGSGAHVITENTSTSADA